MPLDIIASYKGKVKSNSLISCRLPAFFAENRSFFNKTVKKIESASSRDTWHAALWG